MRSSSFIIFLLVALAIYGLINFYIVRRGWQALSGTGFFRTIMLIFFLLLILSFVAGRILIARLPGPFAEAVALTGNTYLAMMDFLFLFVVLIDFLRVINAFFPFFPKFIQHNGRKAALITFFFVMGSTMIILLAGAINAARPRLHKLDISIPKPAGKIETLNIVVVSDIHLSPIIRNERLDKIVGQINSLGPDLVLLPGDIVNEDTSQKELEEMAVTLRKLRPRFGAFAATGNHEYFGGIARNLKYIRQGNVAVLEDEAVCVANSFYVVGRKDRTSLRPGERRKPLKEIMDGLDRRLPILLLDHQPVSFAESEENGVDLQVSGHTHNGQIFPINLINKLVYKVNYGYYRQGMTQYYVSSGVGTWGPPIRVGSVPEIVQIRVVFK
jgi:hypothetical protein